MVRERRNEKQNDDQPSGRRRPKKSGPPMVPILGLVVLMGGAVYLARMFAAEKPAEQIPKTEVQASEVFGDLPAEEPPPLPTGSGSKRLKNLAPEGLANYSAWVRAKEIASEAYKVLEVAKKAKAEGNHSEWNTKGIFSKNLFDEAITMTAIWEEGLLEKYGDKDRQVQAIMSERSKWFDMLRTLHKTTSR